MRKVELRPLESNQPGHGQLVIIGWEGASEGLSVDIQRNQDECFLQNDGHWRSNAFKLHLPALQPTADGHLAAVVDEEIVDPLLESPHATNMARFYGPDGAQVGRARLRIAQGLMPSGASGSSPEPKAGAALNTPQPVPEPSEPQSAPEPAVEEPAPASSEPVPEPEPAPASSKPMPTPAGKSKRWLWILLAVLLLAAILGAAAWFGLAMREQEEPPVADEAAVEESAPNEASEESVPEATAPGETAAVAGPCSVQRMGEMSELEFIQACTATGSEADNMLQVISEARDNSHCGIARRLYAHQALNGDIAAAMAYAREFDPANHTPNACFPEPDAETAIFWYETAQGLDADNTEASQRLEELQG